MGCLSVGKGGKEWVRVGRSRKELNEVGELNEGVWEKGGRRG